MHTYYSILLDKMRVSHRYFIACIGLLTFLIWTGSRMAPHDACRHHVGPSCFLSKYHRSEEHTSELQSRLHLVCRLLLEKKKIKIYICMSMVQLMAVFIYMQCTLCGHFLQVTLTLILFVGSAICASLIVWTKRVLIVTVS